MIGTAQSGAPQPLPRIALVTPCLNQEKLVGQTLASVVEQGYPHLEYVVVDGGSSDGSVEVIQSFSDRLAYWVSEPDEGHYPAVNKGFARTTADIMGYLNGDDTLLPGSLALVAQIFTDFPEIEWITGAHLAIDTIGRPVQLTFPARWSRWHLLSDRVDRFVPQESTFWRRTLWDRAGGQLDEHYRLAGDFELWARFSRYAQLHTVYAPIGCFRFVAGQRSVAQAEGYLREVAEIRKRERETSSADRSATRRASAMLRADAILGSGRVRRVVDTALGAPPEIIYDQELARFTRAGIPNGGSLARSAFQRLVRPTSERSS